jgi:DNA repair exonuclease SbcCD ATPase subunit
VKIPEAQAKQLVAFGHLSINGAVQNTKHNTRYNGVLGPDVFQHLKRTYTGHFHVHQRMDHRVTYVGSPLQFDFGDAGDQRGVMIYDTTTDTDEFIISPYYDAFRVINAADVDRVAADPSFKDTFVKVIFTDMATPEDREQVKNRLLECGVLTVKEESVIEKAIREQDVTGVAQVGSVIDLIDTFVERTLSSDLKLDPKALAEIGKRIVTQVNAETAAVGDGVSFNGDIVRITMENFLGVQAETVIDIGSLAPGMWFLEGPNGAGKSTILEAICWCYFDEFIRSGMAAGDAVNDKVNRNCRVRIDHSNGWSIERFRKHKQLGNVGVKVYKNDVYQPEYEKGSHSATQQKIIDLLGIDYTTFCRSIILGQNVTANFISGAEADRRTLIEGMLGLERFDKYLECVRNIKKEIEGNREQQESIKVIRSSEVERSTSAISQTEVALLEANQRYMETLNAVAQAQHDAKITEQKEIQSDQAAIEAAVEAEAQARAKWQDAKNSLDAVLTVNVNAKAAIQVAQANVQSAESRLREVASICDAMLRHSIALAEEGSRLNQEEGQLRDWLNKNPVLVINRSGWQAEDEQLIRSRDELAKLQESRAAMVANVRQIMAQHDAVTNRNKHLTTLSGKVSCPTCDHPLDAAGIAAVLERDRIESETLKSSAISYAQPIKDIDQQIAIAQQGIQALNLSVGSRGAEEARVARITAEVAAKHERLAVIGKAKEELGVKVRGITPAYDQQLGGLSPKDAKDKAARELEDRRTALNAIRYDQNAESQASSILEAARAVYEAAMRRSSAAKEAMTQNTRRRQESMDALKAEEGRLRANNPTIALQQTLGRLKEDRAKTMTELDAARALAEKLNQQLSYMLFWNGAFASKGTMRAFLLEESVVGLNLLVQSYSSGHFDGQMTLHFNSDLTVQERYGKRSGGQRKWTDLSILFALFELVHQRCRYRPAFMGLDEAFDALDAKGRRAVWDLLAILQQRIPRIFVITHVDIPGITRAGSIRVSLGESGSQFEVHPT